MAAVAEPRLMPALTSEAVNPMATLAVKGFAESDTNWDTQPAKSTDAAVTPRMRDSLRSPPLPPAPPAPPTPPVPLALKTPL